MCFHESRHVLQTSISSSISTWRHKAFERRTTEQEEEERRIWEREEEERRICQPEQAQEEEEEDYRIDHTGVRRAWKGRASP